MPTYKFKGGLYKNVEEIGLEGLSPEFINGYFDEFNNVNKRPGYSVWHSLPGTGRIQGLFFFRQRNCLIAVKNGRIYKVDFNKNVTDKTTNALTNTTNPVSFACDGAAVLMASGGRMVLLDWNTGENNAVFVADTDAPTSVTHVVYLDGYFIANSVGTHKFYFTSPTDRSSWSSLDFASAEANPDTIVAIHVFNRELYLFGQKTIEFWYNSGSPPFSRMGSGVIEVGCSAPYSIVQTNNTFYWLDDNKRFVRLAGRGVEPVSMPIQTELHKVDNMLSITAVPLSMKGKNWILLNLPSLNVTYCYDVDLNFWYQWGTSSTFTALPITSYAIVDSGLTTTFLSQEQKCDLGYSMGEYQGYHISNLAWTNPSAITESISGYAECKRHVYAPIPHYPTEVSQQWSGWQDVHKALVNNIGYASYTYDGSNYMTPPILYFSGFNFYDFNSSSQSLTGLEIRFGGFSVGSGTLRVQSLTIKARTGSYSYRAWGLPIEAPVDVYKSYPNIHTITCHIGSQSDLTFELLNQPDTEIWLSFVVVNAQPYTLYLDWMSVKLISTMTQSTFIPSQILAAQRFGFTIPPDATITGMSARYDIIHVEGNPTDYQLWLMVNDQPIQSTLSRNEVFTTPYYIRGGVSEMWGAPLTPSAVNSPTFGIGLMIGTHEGDLLRVGDVTLTVYYRTAIQGFETNLGYLFGDTSGRIIEFKSHLFSDVGSPVIFKWRTGNIHYDTLHFKRSNRVIFRLKRGSTEMHGTSFQFRWRDDNATWSSVREVSLGNVSDIRNTIDLHRLGIYISRQYEITHSQPTNFVLVDVEEKAEVLTK